MSRLGFLLVVAFLFCGAVRSAVAAEREFVGVLALAVDKNVADELQLTDEQRQKLSALIERRENEVLELALSLRQADAAEREVKLAPFRRASEAEGLKLLDDRQRALLEQLRLRRAGSEAFAEPNVAKALNLTAEQQSARDALLTERAARLAKASGAEREVLRIAFEQKLLGLLTADQKKTWETTTGAAIAEPAQAKAAEPAQKPAATAVAAKTNPASTAAAGDARLKFNFRYQPWGEVLDWFAEQAGLSLLMDAPPPGTLNYTDPRSYTPAEALDLMNGVLLTKGYTLVRRERMLIVVNLEDGIPPNLVSFIPADKLDERGEFELLTTLFSIGSLDPDDVEKELRRLVGPQGSVVVLPNARQVQATETAGRLRLMRAVLRASTEAQATNTGPIQAFEPTHIAAVDALPLLRQLLNIAEDSYSDADGSVRLAVDPITGKLLVGGKPERVTQVGEIMKAIDVPAPTATTTVVETPQLETYDVGAIDSTTALAVLQTILAGTTDVRLTVDPNSGKLIALARPSQHATIRATLDQLQREGRQVDVIQLQRLDPALAATAVVKLFGTGTAGAPQVDADPISRQLIVRGTAGQLAAIRELLTKMGEQAVGGGPTTADTSTVRVLPLNSGSARRALEQLEAVWPTLRSNRIKIVTPSSNIEAIYPSGRDAVPQSPPAGAAPPAPPPPKAAPTGKPATGGAPATDDPQTRDAAPKRPVLVRTVSFLQQPPAANPQANSDAPPTTKPSMTATKEPPPIIVSLSPGGIVIASDDVEALNEFESLFNSLVNQATAAGQEFTVFYLENAGAIAAAETLEAVFGSGGGGGSSLMGNLASMALGDVGGGLVGAMMGGSSGPAPSITSSAPVLIVPDVRLNALIVQAAPADLDLIEQLLRVIDRVDVPESTVNPKPRIIPVRNTSAAQVAEVVREVYQERLAGANRQRQPSPEEFMQMLRGGGGGGGQGRSGASSSSRNRQAEAQKISIGIDARTNSLIVSASEPVFQEIEQLVRTLDQTTIETNQAIRVVTLKRSNAVAVQKALAAIVGDDVQTTRKPSGGSSGGNSEGGGSNPNSGLSNEARQVQELMRQRMEMFNQLRGGGGGGLPSRGEGNRNDGDRRGR